MTRPTSTDLAKVPLFGGMSKEALEMLAQEASVVELARGDVVFREGEEPAAIFVVARGTVGVFKSRGIEELCLVHLDEGEMIGEMGFVDMQPRAGTVRADAPARLWKWEYPTMRALYKKDLHLYTLLIMNIARELSRRLRRADAAILKN